MNLKQATAPRDTSAMTPVTPSAAQPQFPPVSSNMDPGYSPLAIAPIPPVLGTDTDAARQYYRGGAPQWRMPPLPAAASIAAGAQGQSQAEIAVAAATASGTGSLKMPNIFDVTGSIPVTNTPAGGPIVVSLAPENAFTFLAGPLPGMSGSPYIDASETAFDDSPVGSASTSALDPATLYNEWAIFVVSATESGSTPAFTPATGWAQLQPTSGSAAQGLSWYTNTQGLSVTPEVSFNPNAQYSAVSALFYAPGGPPVVVQSKYAAAPVGGTTTNIAFTADTTPGNLILLFVEYLGTSAAAVSALSDTQANVWTLIGTASSDDSGLYTFVAVYAAFNSIGGADTVSFTATGSPTQGMAWIAEVSGATILTGIPTFRNITIADLPSTVMVNPMTTLGDMIYENATPAPARLPGSASTTKHFLTQTGTGSASAEPAWGTIAVGDLPTSGTWPFVGTISGNLVFSGDPKFTGEILDGSGSAGTSGYVLTSQATSVAWAAPSSLLPLTTEGDILYENATPAPARLAIGSTGEVLTVSGGLPVWAAASTGSGGTQVKTANYTAVAGDAGTLLAFNTSYELVQYSIVSSTSITLGATPKTGDLLVIYAFGNSSGTPATPSGGGVVSWTQEGTPQINAPGGSYYYTLWWGVVGASPSATITVSGGGASGIAVAEFSGNPESSVFDHQNQGTGSGTTLSETVAATSANELVVGFFSDSAAPGTGYAPLTFYALEPPSASSNLWFVWGVAPTAGTQTPGLTFPTGSTHGGNVATFNPPNITLTLPASPPSSTWAIFVENWGNGTLLINPNSLLIDDSGSNLTVPPNQGVYITTDGTNYYTERGLTSVGSVTGILPVANGGTGANLSATGGTSYVVQQSSTGAAFTVGQLAASNLSNGTTGSGAVVLATSGTWTPVPHSVSVSGTVTYGGTYTNFGNLVFMNLQVNVAAGSSIAFTGNSSYFTGLPFTSARNAAASQTASNVTGTIAQISGADVYPGTQTVGPGSLNICGTFELT